MTLQERIDILERIGEYMQQENDEWRDAKRLAFSKNHWFIPEFIELSAKNIAQVYLQKDNLQQFAEAYNVDKESEPHVNVGLVMAGNIPMVGFHDMLCIFISGHKQTIKLSTKDAVLVPFLVNKMIGINKKVESYISFAEKLIGCDAFIATGSNNTSRYFEYYFSKFPNIIRKNRTSVAILKGNETEEDLEKLSDDIQLYFGLGCRNITKLYVPEQYNFEPLLNALRKYNHYADIHKYRNNYDYQLALLMMGSKYYMTNESVVFSENKSIFSAVSHVHYEFYKNKDEVLKELANNDQVQCVVSNDHIKFGEAQKPSLMDYADGIDTMKFLMSLKNNGKKKKVVTSETNVEG